MTLLFKIAAAILFVIFFGFALKNTDEVVLRFFWDYEIRKPLVLMFFRSRSCAGRAGNDTDRVSLSPRFIETEKDYRGHAKRKRRTTPCPRPATAAGQHY
jgi:hypothetical protein